MHLTRLLIRIFEAVLKTLVPIPSMNASLLALPILRKTVLVSIGMVPPAGNWIKRKMMAPNMITPMWTIMIGYHVV